MKYSEMTKIFREHESSYPTEHLTAHIIFTEDSFDRRYPRISRTYCLSSNNKAFQPNKGGYSIFACCLDGSDQGVRLEWYMAGEGNAGGWKVEDCYILERMRDVAAIQNFRKATQDDGTVCYFFGDTTIRVEESIVGGKLRLKPVKGDQISCGEWPELDPDVVNGYCTLLDRHISKKSVQQ